MLDVINARICAKRDTTANWNSNINFVPMLGEIIVYMDHGTMDDGYGNTINVPGVKIGDGNTYLIDLPFVGSDERYAILQELRNHENNWNVHVSPEDRAFWNNKLNYTIDSQDEELLILNRN